MLELSGQVPLMSLIYSSAELTIAWLGAGSDELERGFETFSLLSREYEAASHQSPREFFSLRWIKKHPHLTMYHPSEPLPSKNFLGLYRFLDLTYWRRVWVMQELALSSQVLLSYGQQTLPYCSSNAAGQLANAIIQLPLYPAQKPEFVSLWTWKIFKDKASPSWSPLVRIAKLRGEELKGRELGLPDTPSWVTWARSKYAFALRATQPKDYIYEIMGLTRINVVPDYTDATFLASLYVQYVVAYLDFCRSQDAQVISGVAGEEPELSFLRYCGIGLIDDSCGIPSWAPNFPNISEGRVVMLPVVQGKPDAGVFPDTTKHSRVDMAALSLHTTGAQIDTVLSTTRLPTHESMVAHRKGRKLIAELGIQAVDHEDLRRTVEAVFDGSAWFSWFEDFSFRHPQYLTGMPALQAIYRTLRFQLSYTPDPKTLASALGLIGMLRGVIQLQGPDSVPVRGLEKFGFVAGMSGNEMFTRIFAPNDSFGVNIGVGADGDFRQAGYGSQSLHDLALQMASNPSLLPFHSSWRLFETHRGYLGVGPDKLQPGGRLCVLAGSNHPVLLRKTEDSFLHVGQCFVLGLMEGEATKLVKDGYYKIEQFKLK
ncbi:hypothetical protein FALCPG4_005666 [Fusarium falciforme]